MPGCEAVLGFARNPLEFGRARVAELAAAGKPVNLARNAGFDAAAPAADGQPARPAEWGFWQAEGSKGTASHDAETGAAAKGSARAAGVSNGCFTQSVDAQPGEHYLVRAKRRQQGHGTSWIRVRWQTADVKWTREVADQLFYPVSADPGWQEVVGVAEVPDGVGKLVILLCAAGAESAEDVVWFDDVELVKLD
ncbi:MAG: hypothetical protein HYU66_13010, partial [Armatimonadetes bacterium]|nr:hypothetical protein [Armatimonadota bacterium]